MCNIQSIYTFVVIQIKFIILKAIIFFKEILTENVNPGNIDYLLFLKLDTFTSNNLFLFGENERITFYNRKY